MKRPYVICHMIPSVDGRIVTKNWSLQKSALKLYEKTADSFKAEAWIIGRISMEPYAGKTKIPKQKAKRPIPRTDFIAPNKAKSFAIAIDPSGKLTWKENRIDEAHVISILTEKVSDDYLAFLQSKQISYIFCGRTEIHLKKALQKLAKYFSIRRLLLEGGGKINGSFLAADLIDELSLLMVPVADGGIGTPTLFDSKEGPGPTRSLKLLSIRKLKNDLLWLRYKVRIGKSRPR